MSCSAWMVATIECMERSRARRELGDQRALADDRQASRRPGARGRAARPRRRPRVGRCSAAPGGVRRRAARRRWPGRTPRPPGPASRSAGSRGARRAGRSGRRTAARGRARGARRGGRRPAPRARRRAGRSAWRPGRPSRRARPDRPRGRGGRARDPRAPAAGRPRPTSSAGRRPGRRRPVPVAISRVATTSDKVVQPPGSCDFDKGRTLPARGARTEKNDPFRYQPDACAAHSLPPNRAFLRAQPCVLAATTHGRGARTHGSARGRLRMVAAAR